MENLTRNRNIEGKTRISRNFLCFMLIFLFMLVATVAEVAANKNPPQKKINVAQAEGKGMAALKDQQACSREGTSWFFNLMMEME